MNKQILNYLPSDVKRIINKCSSWLDDEILEIRLRAGHPLQLITDRGDYLISIDGKQLWRGAAPYLINQDLIKQAMLILTNNSLYAVERQLREGFITIEGGHRVGFTGQVIYEAGRLKTIKNISSLNYRITRELIGVGEKVITSIYDQHHDIIFNTLILSPPLCGKTTLLRDLIRLISTGLPEKGLRGRKVGVVDERSEIGGAYNGISQNNLGERTDLLDNCLKADGMMMLIRAMSPEVIAVDEIGRREDVEAIKEAVNSGVSLITTVHGTDLSSLKLRPEMKTLIDYKLFRRYIVLSRRKGVGTIEKVLNERGEVV